MQDIAFTHGFILVLAASTMIIGVLSAIVQNHFKRILSYHIISQIGYMILGLASILSAGVGGVDFTLSITSLSKRLFSWSVGSPSAPLAPRN